MVRIQSGQVFNCNLNKVENYDEKNRQHYCQPPTPIGGNVCMFPETGPFGNLVIVYEMTKNKKKIYIPDKSDKVIEVFGEIKFVK